MSGELWGALGCKAAMADNLARIELFRACALKTARWAWARCPDGMRFTEMQSADARHDEGQSLEALRALRVLDTAPEPEFDALVRAASLACGTPIALISLVDAKRQWFKANLGLPGVTETPRDVAFCAHAVLGDELFEVPDATQDSRFADNPLVSGQPNVRFYAGAPVRLSGGQRIGTLCIIDHQPRRLDDSQREILRSLALVAAQALEGRQASKRLRKSEDFLDRTGRIAGVGGWELDIASGEVTWSDETRRIHGVALDFHPVLDEAINFYAPESRPVIQAAVEHGMASGEGWDLELTLIRATGDRIWVRAVGSVEFHGGRPVRLVGAVQDISERKNLELKLGAILAEVQDLYDNPPCGYHSLDATGTILHINATALSWLGCRREDVVGKRRITEFFTPEGQEQFRQNFGVLMSTGRVEGLEFDLVPAAGIGRRVSVTATAVKDADGKFLMSRTVMFDITLLKEAEEARSKLTALEALNAQLQEAGRLKDQFVANMSHELRTPLNAVIGYAHLLQSGTIKPESPKFVPYLTQIGASGKHLLQLIESMLDFAKTQSGKMEFRPERTYIAHAINDVIDMLQDACERKRVVAPSLVSSDLIEAEVDPARLRQVLLSLLSNAIKFSNEYGRIDVRAQIEGESRFRVEIEDYGIGIADADLPRLFNHFHQLSAGNTKTHEGTGLGLALVRRMIEAQGGSVGVRSKLGEGSVFHFTLPLVAAKTT
jgi:PAS domain S-box-containing protein